MRRRKLKSSQPGEEGVVILLVAVVLLFIVAAMAALAIDLVTFYTARSEAQLAADGAALAGARVLANSGTTSNPGDAALFLNTKTLAETVATQVATNNQVGGRFLNTAEVTPNVVAGLSGKNPRITVRVQRQDLPTFFAKIWGNSSASVSATATAEAYNPSGLNVSFGAGAPVAPTCVKPWLLPNMDPTGTNPAIQIFDPGTGAIVNPGLVGQSFPGANPDGLYALCNTGGNIGDCSGGLGTPAPGRYYPGVIDPANFPEPTQALPSCSATFIGNLPYQHAVAGCVQKPIGCGLGATINIDQSAYGPNRDLDTAQAVGCMIHYSGAAGDSDSIDLASSPPPPPFQFLAGNNNPITNAIGKDIPVSDSLVTVPVYDSSGATTSTVTVIGFVQLFLNPTGAVIPVTNRIPATIINMAGCGTNATGQPILGNGASPVPVRLITPP